jgi:Flp pilus assembly protein TadG
MQRIYTRRQIRGRGSRRGFSLLTTTVCLLVMVGMVGLALDLGRMYIAKNELQGFADAAALAAAFELDGTTQGITRATAVATTGPGPTPNRWQYGSQAPTSVQVEFSNTSTGGWQNGASIATAANYRFVRVIASGILPLTLMQALQLGTSRMMRAAAVSGQGEDTTCGMGCAPFSPDAPNPALASWGFVPGQLYTMKWAPHGQRRSGTLGMCAGDEVAGTPDPAGSDRGYIDVGQGSGDSGLHNAIVNQDFPATVMHLGDTIDVVTGEKEPGSAIGNRNAQDADIASATYAAYLARNTGNGRRLIHVPINNPATNQIIGFATFFMQSSPRPVCTNNNNDACCAEFVTANAMIGSKRPPAGTEIGAVYRVKLFGGGI